MKERWYLQTKKADFNEISRKFNISPILARLLRNRNVIGDENIKKYLSPDIERLSSPWMFKDMDKAVDILKIKIAAGNRIRVICDYDVDGVCSGYILYRSLKKLGAVVDVVVPHRIEDGYGINENLIKKAFDQGIDTILTCDNGIAAYNQVEYAKSLGMTIIVTDHHEVPYTETEQGREYIIPKADAVINHKQKDCGYPFKELCGAMVALQLISALTESYGISKRDVYRLLPYAALATICDVVELQGENRMVVQYGLKMIKNCKDVGLNALIDACKIDKNNIDSYHIGFVLGPCINASGRLDTAKRAMELLCETDREKADILAKSLKELNDERKDMTEEGTRRAIEIAKNYEDKVLVIYLNDCHESIAGIIAGRVREMYNFDKSFGDFQVVAGVDEVGRGPLAGPIVSCAVVLDLNVLDDELILWINDSKKINEKKREELAEIIKEKAVAYYIASRDSKEIDTRGIGVCNNEVFLEACNSLKIKPDLVLSDGYTVKGIQIPNKAVIKGDTKSACIAAASIVAKVYRDSLMKEYSKKYPHYAFEENAGYGTSKHIAGLKEYGPTEIHRMSFLNNILSY